MFALSGSVVPVRHLRRFLKVRNETIKFAAESDVWQRYLG
jgi:hypothetical protein